MADRFSSRTNVGGIIEPCSTTGPVSIELVWHVGSLPLPNVSSLMSGMWRWFWADAQRIGCGNSVLSYFMSAVLDTAGINDSIGKANVSLGYSVFQFVFAVAGAHFVERIGRRKMMLCGFFGVSVVWICMTASAGTLASSLVSGSVSAGDAKFSNHNAANAVLAFIFIYGGVYSFNITPLQALYPVECISFEIRAKGMAFQSFFVNAAGLLNQFAWPIAIKKIEWKTYIIFIVWTAIQGVLAYFFFPETRKRTVRTRDKFITLHLCTFKLFQSFGPFPFSPVLSVERHELTDVVFCILQLEELDKIFEAKNPVKYSVQSRTLAITEDRQVVAVDKDSKV